MPKTTKTTVTVNSKPKKTTRTVVKTVRPKNKTRKQPVKRALREAMSIRDRELLSSTRKLVQNVFSGATGINRGLSLGSQLTGLARFRATYTLNIPAGTYLSYIWAPAALASGANFRCAYSNNGSSLTVAPTDPWNAAGTSTVNSDSVAGPWNGTNPSTEYRLVRGAMTVTPMSSVLQQGGVQCHIFSPNVYTGGPASANYAAIGLTDWPALSTYVNFEQHKLIEGTTPMVLQWYPNDDEIYVEPGSNYLNATTPFGGFCGYIRAPSTNTISYVLEFDWGIEYVPNSAYRPYVDKALPEDDPDAFQQLNKFVSKHWDETVIATRKQYDEFVARLEHEPVTYSSHYQSTGHVGFAAPSLPILQRQSVLTKACDAIGDLTGYDVCDMVYERAVGATTNAAQKVMNQVIGYPSRGMLGY